MNLATNKENYCGTIVKITELYPLKDCDNVVGTKIFGSQVIIPRGTPLNEMGVYFPAGSKLSDDFIKYNNLSRYPELNVDGDMLWICDYFNLPTYNADAANKELQTR